MFSLKNILQESGINQKSLLNPLILALLPAVLIIWLQPLKFTPLVFELYRAVDNYSIWLEDLEGDGKAEQFSFGNERSEGHAFISYYNDEDQLIGQHNFNHPIARNRDLQKPYTADFNKDGVKELVYFTQHEDSLFINAFDYKTQEGFLESRFVTSIGGLNENKDYHINHLGHFDVNADMVPEYFFSVAAGFAWYPRRIYRYDFQNDSLIHSVNTGAGYLKGAVYTNKDSVMIAVGSIAFGNIREDYPHPYHDTTTWFFAFDQDLNLLFEPKKYGVYPSGIELPHFKDGYIYYLYGSNNAQPENKLFKMDWNGKLADSLSFDFYISKRFAELNYKKQNILTFYNTQNGERYSLNTDNFETNKIKALSLGNANSILTQVDLGNDKKPELITYNHLTRQLFIYNHNISRQYTFDPGFVVRQVCANYYSDSGYGYLMLNSDQGSKTYRYQKNPAFYWKYPLWLAIYLASVLFMGMIMYFQNLRYQKQQQMEQQLADLQLQNLRNQLDPHFTFNVLNSVGNAIYKQDKEGAYDLFQRFTRIIRSSLMSSDKVFRSLREELRFTEDYLEFQKLRFKDRFTYKIEVRKGIDSEYIQFPKMLIQGYAENAVKHAFYGVDYTGLISIKVYRDNDSLVVSIKDNGIGIQKSKEGGATSGTQKGMKVLEEQVEQINRIYSTHYSLETIDMNSSTDPNSGTRIRITLPI